MDDVSVIPHFGSHLSSRVVIYGCCLVICLLTINETLKWLLSLAAHLNVGIISMVTV